MNYLLDTNVLSEWVKPRPNVSVIRWLAEVPEENVYLSVVTFAEIAQGIEEMPQGKRREMLRSWLENDVQARFDQRILAIDLPVANESGVLAGKSRKAGVSINPMDAFLAATCKIHDLTLATRNTRDFAGLGIPLSNPWHGETPR